MMRRQAQGFTLIELSVVLLIVVIGFAAISSNISSGNQAAQLKATARDLASALRYARGHALLSHKEVIVAINLAENTYQLSNRKKIYSFSDQIDVTLEIAQDEFKQDEVGQLRFYTDGSSSGGKITLEMGGLIDTIDVNWLTGKVEITEE